MSPHDEIRSRVAEYYTGKVVEHGATHLGVDWSTGESQRLRFDMLLTVAAGEKEFTINDFGCGYGALVEHLDTLDIRFRYTGFDMSAEMISRALELYGQRPNCTFTTDPARLQPADYTVASGVLNVKAGASEDEWSAYVADTIETIARLSVRGFAFNMLTKYSDPERMREDLHYADPCFWFDHCKRNYSRWVALLHDYGLYEFTIRVRNEEASW